MKGWRTLRIYVLISGVDLSERAKLIKSSKIEQLNSMIYLSRLAKMQGLSEFLENISEIRHK